MGVFNRVVPVIVLAVALVGCAGRTVSADGPYSGRVVDAETKQPLAGAVVLAIWMKYVPVGAHMPEAFVDAVEVVTDANGEFAIPEQRRVPLLGALSNPKFVIFAPGYGYAPLYQTRPVRDIPESFSRHAIVELPRWSMAEERLRISDISIFVSKVPPDRMSNLIDLVKSQRQRLGLPPGRIGGAQ